MWQGLFPAAPVPVPARLLSAQGQLAGNFNTFSHPESPESNRPPQYHPPSVTYTHKQININVLFQQPFSQSFFISLLFSVPFLIWLYSHYICQLLRPIFIYRSVCLTSPLHFSPQNLIILKYWLSRFFFLLAISNISASFSLFLSLHLSLCRNYNDWASEQLTRVVFLWGDSLNIGLNFLYRNTRMHMLLATQA